MATMKDMSERWHGKIWYVFVVVCKKEACKGRTPTFKVYCSETMCLGDDWIKIRK